MKQGEKGSDLLLTLAQPQTEVFNLIIQRVNLRLLATRAFTLSMTRLTELYVSL